MVHKRDDAHPIRNNHPSSPPRKYTSFVMLTKIMNEIHDLQAFVGNKFDNINARVAHLEEDLNYLRHQFGPSGPLKFYYIVFSFYD